MSCAKLTFFHLEEQACLKINKDEVRQVIVACLDTLLFDSSGNTCGQINALGLRRLKYQQIKVGLIHDLLTGKVPVKVEEPEMVDG